MHDGNEGGIGQGHRDGNGEAPPQAPRSGGWRFLLVGLWIGALILFIASGSGQKPSGDAWWTVVAIGKDAEVITLLRTPLGEKGEPLAIAVPEPLRVAVSALRPGDRLAASAVPEAEKQLESVRPLTIAATMTYRISGLIWAVLTVPCIAVLLRISSGRDMLLGPTARYSNSATQIFLWFSVVIGAYLVLWAVRWQMGGGEFLGGISIPANLLLLSGMSGFTFAGAKWIDASPAAKVRASAPDARPKRSLSNLVEDRQRNADIADLLMLVVTLVAVFTYLVQYFYYLAAPAFLATVSLPDVDSTLLALFGLGQGTYLTRKVVSS